MAELKSKLMNPKRSASKLLKDLPNDCTYEDIQYHLYVMHKIERGLLDAENGKTYTTEEMKTALCKWLRI